eukprot:863309-Rhodomonas_salina.1
MGKEQSGHSKLGGGDGKTHPGAQKSLTAKAVKQLASKAAVKAGRGKSHLKGGLERMKQVQMGTQHSGEEDDNSEREGSDKVSESDRGEKSGHARELRVQHCSQTKKKDLSD